MTDLKKITPSKILWIDLEMTGLDPAKDRIVELAAIVTDWDFNELAMLETGVGHDVKMIKKLVDANPFYDHAPNYKQDALNLVGSSPTEKLVQQQLAEFIEAHFKNQPALLAGNSIHMDRRFIRQWWPEVEEKLHYRMLDVSAWKVVMTGKYSLEFPKKETHRALDDIRESITELKFYLQKTNLKG